jgi:uncharacterized protein (TIGR02246 family)
LAQENLSMLKRTSLSAIVLVLCAVPTPAQPAKNPEFQKLADAFVAAWNKGDAKALAALHAENCITSGGDTGQLVGRAAVEQDLTKSFATILKGTKLIVTSANERMINPDLAVTSGTYEITGPTPPPPGANTRGVYINSLVKQGGKWLIASSAAIPAPAKP